MSRLRIVAFLFSITLSLGLPVSYADAMKAVAALT